MRLEAIAVKIIKHKRRVSTNVCIELLIDEFVGDFYFECTDGSCKLEFIRIVFVLVVCVYLLFCILLFRQVDLVRLIDLVCFTQYKFLFLSVWGSQVIDTF